MENNYEKRMLLLFALIFAITIAFFYLFPAKKQPAVPAAQESASSVAQTTAAPVNTGSAAVDQAVYKLKSELSFAQKAKAQLIVLSNAEMNAVIDTGRGAVQNLSIQGSWNRRKVPVVLVDTNLTYGIGDLSVGSYEMIGKISNFPGYTVRQSTPEQVVLSLPFTFKGARLELTRTYSLVSNYQIQMTVAVTNLSSAPVMLDVEGRSLSLASEFRFFNKSEANAGNLVNQYFYSGNKLQKPMNKGLMFWKPAVLQADAASPRWTAMGDNYFLGAVIPNVTTYTSKLVVTKQDGVFNDTAIATEFPALFLEAGKGQAFDVKVYAGPKKQDSLKLIDKTFKKIFAWWNGFNWIMNPIQFGLVWLLHLLAGFIPNWGVTIIIFALLIKLLLSPLSINAAISIKKTSLLQPKIKNLQDKYKDDQKTLNEKMAELYKKEGVNPIGGCLPLILQIPVFIVLYRVLSTSVELRGATFLYIKDLTQPDALFMLNLPFFHGPFNLLPIIMTVTQLFQMLLQMNKATGTAKQQQMNMFILPIVMLFMFWGMPAGLVLYWTIVNIYVIIEQEIVNLDRHIKLKK